jgi:superfamily I DNA and RNA helicase
VFLRKESITFTSIYRAKGNEAAMVYVMNAQYTAGGSDILSKRNILFTAITRTKAWIRVTGVGRSMEQIIGEFEKVKEQDFSLDFTYPGAEERKK